MTIQEKPQKPLRLPEPPPQNKNDLIRGFLDGFEPIPTISVSEWGNKYRYLSNAASARPGQYDIAVTPYLKEIVDCLSETSDVQEVVFMKGAQIGATEVGNNWIGYIIHIAPAATLMVMPNEETARRNSQIRLDPMIEASPELQKKIQPSRRRDSGNKTLQKEFPGGLIIISGAGSPAGLRSLPIKNVMFDEVDGYPPNVGKEGSALALGKARTNTYADTRKIFYISTPTIDGRSAIQKEYANSDQRKFFVPCPECHSCQELVFSQLKYEDNDPETVRYECIHCGFNIEERHKPAMVRAGYWEVTNKEWKDKKRRGYHLNALYSLLGYKWSNAVQEYLDAKGDDLKMCTFVNVVLGEVWKESVDVPDWAALYARRESYGFNKPPIDVALITATADIQKDRIEVLIKGWCKNIRNYCIDYRTIMGDTSSIAPWNELAKIVDETWVRSDGAIMPLRMMGVDTGAYTSDAYNFCRRFPGRVLPLKGRPGLDMMVANPKAVEIAKDGKPIGKMRVWGVGVDIIKSELYGHLRQVKIDGEDYPRGYAHFPMYDETYFKQLTAEERQIVVNKKGFRVYEWVLPSHRRNEVLDLSVYNRAVVHYLGVDRWTDEDWEITRNEYPLSETAKIVDAQKANNSNKTVKKDDFLGNTGDYW